MEGVKDVALEVVMSDLVIIVCLVLVIQHILKVLFIRHDETTYAV